MSRSLYPDCDADEGGVHIDGREDHVEDQYNDQALSVDPRHAGCEARAHADASGPAERAAIGHVHRVDERPQRIECVAVQENHLICDGVDPGQLTVETDGIVWLYGKALFLPLSEIPRHPARWHGARQW